MEVGDIGPLHVAGEEVIREGGRRHFAGHRFQIGERVRPLRRIARLPHAVLHPHRAQEVVEAGELEVVLERAVHLYPPVGKHIDEGIRRGAEGELGLADRQVAAGDLPDAGAVVGADSGKWAKWVAPSQSPPIEVGIVESNDPHGPFGAKEAGEGSLAAYLWRYEPDPANLAAPQIASTSAESVALSKDLKRLGWRFVGPTTMYAFMQAMGLVNDHASACAIRAEAERAYARFKCPAGRVDRPVRDPSRRRAPRPRS